MVEPVSDQLRIAAISRRSISRAMAERAPGLRASTSAARSCTIAATSEDIDYFDSVIGPAPWVIALVLGLTFVFRTVVFRSVVVAGTAVVLNLLSVGAAYGPLVLVFEHGVGVRADHRLIHSGVGVVARRSVTAAAVPSPSGWGEN